MKEREPFFVGVVLTFFLHVLLGGMIVAKKDDAGCGGGGAVASNFEEAQTIEASLAFKEKEKKSRQPQKKKKKKFKPDPERAISRDADKKPVPKPEEDEDKPKVEPDEIDFSSILEKNRKQDEELSDTGSDEIPVEGSADGSEWGTEIEARGDPYVGELKGRLYSVWKVPSLETGTGNAIGCVRLDEDGKIAERELKQRSKNSNLDRSVELALEQAPDMEEPVPDHLKSLLTEKGICFNFKL